MTTAGTFAYMSTPAHGYCVKKMYAFHSVLTRIIPWGVLGPPLLRNRGPVINGNKIKDSIF